MKLIVIILFKSFIWTNLMFGDSSNIGLAKPKSGARILFPARLKGKTPCPGQD